MKRLTQAEKRRRLEQAQSLASQRATLFALSRRTSKGELLTGFKLLAVKGERHRQNLIKKGARPVLPSSAWRRVYEEVGLR